MLCDDSMIGWLAQVRKTCISRQSRVRNCWQTVAKTQLVESRMKRLETRTCLRGEEEEEHPCLPSMHWTDEDATVRAIINLDLPRVIEDIDRTVLQVEVCIVDEKKTVPVKHLPRSFGLETEEEWNGDASSAVHLPMNCCPLTEPGKR